MKEKVDQGRGRLISEGKRSIEQCEAKLKG